MFCGGYYYWMFIFEQPEARVDRTYYQAQLEEGRLPGMAYQSGGVTEHGVGPETSRDTSHELKDEERRR